MWNTKQALASDSYHDWAVRKFLQTLAMSALLLASASAAQAQVTFGIRIGAPPTPRAYRVPPQPGPDYVWVEGYQYPQGSQYAWHDEYWTRPPMRVRIGSIRTTAVDGILPVSGKVITATSPMTITGTEAVSGTKRAIRAPTRAPTAAECRAMAARVQTGFASRRA